MNKIKAIFFDFGEVFVTSNPKKINHKLKAVFGISFLKEDLLSIYLEYVRGKVSTEEYFLEVLKNNSSNLDVEKIIAKYKELYKSTLKADKSMFNLLRNLKSKYLLVCFSDMNELHRKINEGLGFFTDFDELVFSHETKKLKRDHYFKSILKKFNLKPEEVIFTDDCEINIETSKKVGINSIQFVGKENLVEQLKKLGVIINNT